MSNSQKKRQSKLRERRIFSPAFKQARVKEISNNLFSVSEVSKLYNVSKQSIYRWLYQYSADHHKGTTKVVQMSSEAHKTKQLIARIAELERVVGQKQLEIDYLDTLIAIGSEELKVDLKKNFGTRPSTDSTVVSKKKGSR